MSVAHLTKNRFVETDKINDKTYRLAIELGLAQILDDKHIDAEFKDHVKSCLLDPKDISVIRR